MRQTLKEFLPVLYIFLFFAGLVGILFLICYIPMIYDFFQGDKIVDEHIKEIVGNETDHAKITGLLMQWIHDNVGYPTEEGKKNILGVTFYTVNNQTKFFWRDAPASWIILHKIGRCGEDANYFVGVMDRLGYESYKIRPTGWDHAWAEYYTPDGTKIVLDPSSNQIIYNLTKWVEGKNVTRIEAIDLNGKKEDITSEYIR